MAFSTQYYCYMYACIYINIKMSTLSSEFECNSFQLLIGLIKSIEKVNIEKLTFESLPFFRANKVIMACLWFIC